jgi:hypothetical protein
MKNQNNFGLNTNNNNEICIIEPFYGGSHKQLIDLITNELKNFNLNYDLFTMTSKKWYSLDNARYFYLKISKKLIFDKGIGEQDVVHFI